ncbi:MAG: hypothetical protein HY560_03895 [Gemmatimonadetes bacterium]|nr:hypothetical protein [Gemmatimonadota bacterium]
MTSHLCRSFVVAALSLATLQLSPAAALAQDGAPGVFDSDAVLQLRLATELKTLMDDRDSLKSKPHPATLTYLDAAGQPVTMDVQLQTRGHWRRQKKNCDFAPLRVDFPKEKEQPAGSPFAGQGDLKLVTHCRSKDAVFEQYVLREYLVYQLYHALTPNGFRARLARTTYVDTAAKLDSLTRYAFLLEAEKRLAQRLGGVEMEMKGARFDDLDPDAAALVSLFEYLIGGTDWSLVALHNIVLVQNKENGVVVPIPYDFDWGGLVNTKYSFPDYRLPIKSVRERLYRGVCRTPEQWAPVLQKFRDQKEALYAVYQSLPDLDPKYVKETREYLDAFYKVIDNPNAVKSEIIGPCRQA